MIFILESVTIWLVPGGTAAGPLVFLERTTTVKRTSNEQTLRMGRLRFITPNRHRGSVDSYKQIEFTRASIIRIKSSLRDDGKLACGSGA
jgi:hypothetical protein